MAAKTNVENMYTHVPKQGLHEQSSIHLDTYLRSRVGRVDGAILDVGVDDGGVTVWLVMMQCI